MRSMSKPPQTCVELSLMRFDSFFFCLQSSQSFGFLLQRFDLNLDTFAPYKIDYSREGTHLLIGGKKGHLALINWRKNKLLTEVHAKETVRDVK